MANQQQYSLIYVVGDGALMTEEQSVSMRRSTNSQAIMTVAKGYAGESPGSPMCEIDVKCAVPAKGLEFDFGSAMAALKQVELGLLRSDGKTAKVKGTIVEDTIQHAVDNPSAYDFKWRGPMPQWA